MLASLDGRPFAAVHADVSDRATLRSLGPADASALEHLHRDCPLTVDGGLALLRTPSFFAWPKAVLNSFTYAGAFIKGELDASLAAGCLCVATPSGAASALLLFDARTRPTRRGLGLTDLLALRLIAENASACDLAIVVRRLDNQVAARCTRLTSPVPGTVSLVRPLSVLTLPPPSLLKQSMRNGSEADLAEPALLGRPSSELRGLPSQTFAAEGAAALVADTSTVRSRQQAEGPAPIDVRALSFDDPLEAAALLYSIAASLGRPVRLALSAQHRLLRHLEPTATSRIDCELRLVVRDSRLVDFDNPSASFVFDASLL